MRQLVVTCALLEYEGKYLLTQRPYDKHNGGLWEFPGGKVDFGEDPQDSLQREIKEELGIEVTVGDLFGCSSCVYDEVKHVILLAYHCTYMTGTLVLQDVAAIVRVYPNQMHTYNITQADLPFIHKLQP